MPLSSLIYRERPADQAPEGALILWHGRGADEHDLYPLFDILDPHRLLIGVTTRGPLALPPGGAHWYAVHEVGYPDPSTFTPTYEVATAWLDDWLENHEIPIERAVIGGFSQGCVMSYALALGEGRPRPAGIMGLSGFIPTVPGWKMSPSNAAGLPVAIGHGTYDPVIGVEWGRAARDELEGVGAEVTYREYLLPHTIDPSFLDEVRDWLDTVMAHHA